MYLSGGLTLMLLITAVSVVFTSGALQEKVHYQYGADEQFVMSEEPEFRDPSAGYGGFQNDHGAVGRASGIQ